MEEKNFRCMEEDEIDLIEFFKTIWQRRWFVVGLTSVITLLAVVYATMKTPIYEAKALVEIGNYKIIGDSSNSNGDNTTIYLNSASNLSKKLNALFVGKYKNMKKDSYIVSISVPRKSEGLLEIKADGLSNDLAKKEIAKIIKFLTEKDRVILEDIKKPKRMEIKYIEAQINSLKQREVKFIDEKINLTNKNIQQYKNTLELLDKEININKKKNTTLAILTLLEKIDINAKLAEFEDILIELNDKKTDLLINKLNFLIEKKNRLELLLAPYNYTASKIVGDIITNKSPVKPKKKLIVSVAFITGLILSIFLVFFMEFIKGIKEEVKDEKKF